MARTPKGMMEAWVRSHVNYEGDGDCLPYPYHRDIDGYPTPLYIKKVAIRPNRLMCELKNGPAPSPIHLVAHSCGKGHLGCINPNHMSWKTPKENSADMVLHGTSPVGEKNGTAKLSDEDARHIKTLLKQKIPQRELAAMFGVSQAVVNYINVGR